MLVDFHFYYIHHVEIFHYALNTLTTVSHKMKGKIVNVTKKDRKASGNRTRKVSGYVTDENGEALIGVAICKGTTQGYMLGGTYEVIDRGKKGTDEDYFLNRNIELFNSFTPEATNYLETGLVFRNISNANMMYDYLMDFAQMYHSH